jgi:Tfp pilus assembly protein PilO
MSSYIDKIKEHFWLVIAGLCGILFLFVLISHLFPMYHEVVSIDREIKDNRQKIDQVYNWEGIYDRLVGKKIHLKKQIEQFIFSRNQDTHLSSIITFLYQTAKEKGIHISTLKPREAIREKRYVKLPIELTMTTQFHKIGRFINTIETSEAIIKIESLKISSTKMISNVLRIEIYLTVFYLI